MTDEIEEVRWKWAGHLEEKLWQKVVGPDVKELEIVENGKGLMNKKEEIFGL